VKKATSKKYFGKEKKEEKKIPCNNKTCHDSLEIGKQ